MTEKLIADLEDFVFMARASIYEGNGQRIAPTLKGFSEYEHTAGDWFYRNTNAGNISMRGGEVVYFQDKPFWISAFGGGVVAPHKENSEFVKDLYVFLKSVLMLKSDTEIFCPRGPEIFNDGNWNYISNWEGTTDNFSGDEKIAYKSEVVYTGNYLGGIIE